MTEDHFNYWLYDISAPYFFIRFKSQLTLQKSHSRKMLLYKFSKILEKNLSKAF